MKPLTRRELAELREARDLLVLFDRVAKEASLSIDVGTVSRLLAMAERCLSSRCEGWADAGRMNDALSVCIRQRDEARANLRTYGWHTHDCTRRYHYGECTCGFDAARGEP